MKKRHILSVIVSLVISIFTFSTANAANNILKITSVTLGETSATTEAEITSFSDQEVNANIKFHARYDFADLDFTIKNPTAKPYKLLRIEIENNNPYIEYQYDDHAGTTLNAGDTLNFSLKVIYLNLVTDITERNQSTPANINFVLEDLSDGSEIENSITIVPDTGVESTENISSSMVPDTGKNTEEKSTAIETPVIFIILSIVFTLVALILFSKKHKKLAGISLVFTLAFVALIPLNTRALSVITSNITVEPEIKLQDKVVLTYTDEDGHEQQKIVNWSQPGGAITNPEEKVGYNFSKWAYQDGNDYNPTATVTDDLTLTPVYTPISYHITLNANGAAYDDESLDATYDNAIKLPANYFTNDDLVFTGWNTEPDYSGTHYDDEAEVKNLTTEDGATVNLYAEWGKETYSVYFDPNYENLEPTYPYFYIYTSFSDYLEASSNEFITLPKAEFYGNEGYKFLGWNTERDGSGTHYDDEARAKNLTHEDEIYLYAEWERIESTLITGPEFNTILKTLIGTDTDIYFYNYWDEPENLDSITNKYNIAESGESVWLWREDNTIYWWSEAVPKLNADSSHMFEDLPIESPSFYYLDTSEVVTFESAFKNSTFSYFQYYDYENMNISSLENTSYMFAGSNVSSGIFYDTLTDFSNVTNAYAMFEGCQNLDYVSSMYFGKLENGGNMFKDSAVTSIYASSLITESTTNISGMFENTPSLTSLDTWDWDTTNVTDMSNLFKNTGLESFDLHNIENFSTANVTNMSGMFENTKAEILDLSTFDTSKVTNMDRMFWETEGDAHLTGIYVDDGFVITAYNQGTGQMFNHNELLKGQNGTAYSSEHQDKDYAHIDVSGNPGYLSDVYNKPTCHIKFHLSWYGSDEETTTMPTLFVPGGRDFTLPVNRFENPGFVFLGWYRWYNDSNIIEDGSTITIPEGENQEINLYGKWRPVTFEEAFEAAGLETVTINGQEYYKMQDMTPELCASVGYDSNNIVQTQMVDTRDNKLYWITKNKDSKCWMTQNLDLDLDQNTPLTPNDSDVKANWTPTTTYELTSQNSSQITQEFNTPQSFDLGDIYFNSADRVRRNPATCNLLDVDNCNPEAKFSKEPFETNNTHGHIGNYYNWLAAIASDNYDNYYQAGYSDHTEASIPDTSICPKGWRLPTTTYYTDSNNTIAGEDEYNNIIGYWHWNYDINGTYGADWPVIGSPFYMVPGDLISTNTNNTLVLEGGRVTRLWTNIPTANNTAIAAYFSSTEHTSSMYNTWTKTNTKNAMPIRCVAR